MDIIVRRLHEHDVEQSVFLVDRRNRESKHILSSDVLAIERLIQCDEKAKGIDLDKCFVYFQKFSKNYKPAAVIEFRDLGVKYILQNKSGVSQMYVDRSHAEDLKLPLDTTFCQHDFFSQELIPVTQSMFRYINTLCDFILPMAGTCTDSPEHGHYNVRIYLKVDLKVNSPEGGRTKYTVHRICESLLLTDMFCMIGGHAAMQDHHALRQLSWGRPAPGGCRRILLMGMPFTWRMAKQHRLRVNQLGWMPDDGIVWLYPCQVNINTNPGNQIS